MRCLDPCNAARPTQSRDLTGKRKRMKLAGLSIVDLSDIPVKTRDFSR
jgi:hypothetical protein